jgi:hypothetical protein
MIETEIFFLQPFNTDQHYGIYKKKISNNLNSFFLTLESFLNA